MPIWHRCGNFGRSTPATAFYTSVTAISVPFAHCIWKPLDWGLLSDRQSGMNELEIRRRNGVWIVMAFWFLPLTVVPWSARPIWDACSRNFHRWLLDQWARNDRRNSIEYSRDPRIVDRMRLSCTHCHSNRSSGRWTMSEALRWNSSLRRKVTNAWRGYIGTLLRCTDFATTQYPLPRGHQRSVDLWNEVIKISKARQQHHTTFSYDRWRTLWWRRFSS